MGSGGSEESGDAQAEGPLPPLLWGGCSHHLPSGEVPLFAHLLSNTSGLDSVRMAQGNPRVWLAVMELVHVKTKNPSRQLKKKK